VPRRSARVRRRLCDSGSPIVVLARALPRKDELAKLPSRILGRQAKRWGVRESKPQEHNVDSSVKRGYTLLFSVRKNFDPCGQVAAKHVDHSTENPNRDRIGFAGTRSRPKRRGGHSWRQDNPDRRNRSPIPWRRTSPTGQVESLRRGSTHAAWTVRSRRFGR